MENMNKYSYQVAIEVCFYCVTGKTRLNDFVLAGFGTHTMQPEDMEWKT